MCQREISVQVSDCSIERQFCFVPSKEKLSNLVADELQSYFLKALHYCNDEESIYALTFDFGNNVLSPPTGSYEDVPNQRQDIPQQTQITKLQFDLFKYDGHSWLNALSMFDSRGEKILKMTGQAATIS
jgi:hypothetical protein